MHGNEDYDVYLIKLSRIKHVEWQRTLGASEGNCSFFVQKTFEAHS